MSGHRRTLPALFALLLASTLVLVSPSAADAAAAQGDSGRANAKGWYLALGDSLAAGFQPDAGDDKKGGYAGHVVSELRETAPRTLLVNLSCSGETVGTMVDGGVCRYTQGSQLAQAKTFLRKHRGNTRLITLDVGANDVQRCVQDDVIDTVCVQNGLADVTRELPVILSTLHRAAPRTQLIVLNYYDPFLAAWLTGPDGQALATNSVALLARLNTIIATAGAAVGAPTADVSAAFSTTDFTTQVTLPDFGTVPLNVARICQWTWMCTQDDIHPNDAGYQVIGETVTELLHRQDHD